MKKSVILWLVAALAAFAQYSAIQSTDQVTNGRAVINTKPAARTGTGAPTALACTAGLDVYTDTATGDFYTCRVTGNPGTWDKQARAAGNAATATALATNGTNCSAGQAAAGVDASGNAEGCFSPAGSGQAGGYTTVTFSATPTFTAASNTVSNFALTLTGNVTSSTLASASTGQIVTFRICQDATGGRTFVWPTTVLNASAVDGTASACTNQSFRFDGTNATALGPGFVDGATPGLVIKGSTSGQVTLAPVAIAGTSTVTFPSGNTYTYQANSCGAGQHVSALGTDGTTTCTADAAGSPPGSSGQFIYNNAGAYGAKAITVADLPSEFFAVSTGSANAYVVAPASTVSSYVAGEIYCFQASFTNTGAATANFSGVGAKTIRKWSGGALVDVASGDIQNGAIICNRYDGTYLQALEGLNITPGSMVYPGAGVPQSTGSAWGTSLTLDTDGTLAANSDTRLATQKAAKTYVDTGLAGKASSTAATTVNSQTCTLGSSCTIPLSAVNAQTSTYQALAADFSGYKTITVASGTFTITLVANTSQPAAGQYIRVINYGSGTVTIARSGQNINGGTSSLSLLPGSATSPTAATVISDGTNYFADLALGATLPNGTVATTQSQANNSTSVATTAYVDTGLGTKASSTASTTVNGQTCTLGGTCTVTADPVSARYKAWSCQPGIGDGLNAVAAGTYLQSICYNDTGSTITLTGFRCFSDNAGTSTMNVTNGAGTGLLTGAVTCSTSFAAGTQSGTTTLASGDYLKFTFVADGTTKQSTWVATGSK